MQIVIIQVQTPTQSRTFPVYVRHAFDAETAIDVAIQASTPEHYNRDTIQVFARGVVNGEMAGSVLDYVLALDDSYDPADGHAPTTKVNKFVRMSGQLFVEHATYTTVPPEMQPIERHQQGFYDNEPRVRAHLVKDYIRHGTLLVHEPTGDVYMFMVGGNTERNDMDHGLVRLKDGICFGDLQKRWVDVFCGRPWEFLIFPLAQSQDVQRYMTDRLPSLDLVDEQGHLKPRMPKAGEVWYHTASGAYFEVSETDTDMYSLRHVFSNSYIHLKNPTHDYIPAFENLKEFEGRFAVAGATTTRLHQPLAHLMNLWTIKPWEPSPFMPQPEDKKETV